MTVRGGVFGILRHYLGGKMTILGAKRLGGRVSWALAATLLGGASTFAAEQISLNPKAKGMPLGPGQFYPKATVDVRYDDNLLSTEQNTKSSSITVVSVSGREETASGPTRYALEAGLTDGRYLNSADDNYTDGRLYGEIATYPSKRISGGLRAGFWRLHEDRGTTTLEGHLADTNPHPDVYNVWGIDGKFGYGVEQINAPRLDFVAGYQLREYQNNRDNNSFTRFRDRQEGNLGATFKYMIMPATSLLLEGVVRRFDYRNSLSQLDSDEYRLQGGVTWKATAATSGYVKAGWQRKNFDSSTRQDDDSPAWDLGVEWSPLSQAKFGLSSSRKFDETSGAGDFIDRRESRVFWKHGWKNYLASNLYFSHERDDYGQSPRQDDVDSLGLTVDYQMRSSIGLQFYYTYRTRDTNTDGLGLDYDRNQLGLKLNFAL
jgi:polysaccharide biosynthesis protein VpsM